MGNRNWNKTRFPGVRFRQHNERKVNGHFDRYYVIIYHHNGERKSEAVGWESQGITIEVANEQLIEIKKAQKVGEGAQSLKEKRLIAEQKRIDEEKKAKQAKEALVTFDEVAEKFITWAKINKTTWAWDQQRLRDHILPSIGSKAITTIVPADIEAIKVKCLIDKGLAPGTVVRILSIIRSIFNFGIKNGYHTSGINPVKSVKFPKQNNQRLRFLSHPEADTLLKTAAEYNIELHDMCLISLYSGLRAGEVFRLTWIDLDFEHGLITVRDPKNGESRKAFMTDVIREMFIRKRETRKEDQPFIFPDQKGKVRTMISCQFRHLIDKLGMNSGIEDRRQKLCFHSLRHTFASWLALQGETLQTIMELLGQKSIVMAMRYAHLIPDHKKAAVTRLAATVK